MQTILIHITYVLTHFIGNFNFECIFSNMPYDIIRHIIYFKSLKDFILLLHLRLSNIWK